MRLDREISKSDNSDPQSEASIALLFKATAKEAEALRKTLGVHYPAEEFSLSRLSYPSYRNIHCFEIRFDPRDASDSFQSFLTETLSGISASRV